MAPVDVRSLGYRTDLALLQLDGSVVEDRGTHLVVRTPANPSFHWGNFLLLATPPQPGSGRFWLERFEQEFPGLQHRALGVDGTTGSTDDLAALAEVGLEADASSVMTATSVHAPPHPHPTAVVRPLVSDDDWAQQVALAVAGEPEHYSEEFATSRAAAHRRNVETGHGQWFGAFLDGRLSSSLGIFTAGEGLARFQEVKTHPEARGQGLAGTLVHAASRHALDEMGARTLVMVADPGYLAIRVYRSVGFADTETQLGADRARA
ncbi:GNAT family N-acetyltransferase [Nocardioides panaciterrulae]|uniref:GNAT family N-acetyltransferase n=1 Tax=Nocardioides panaciterrulae TaxID=661492 RepID=UPI001C548B49